MLCVFFTRYGISIRLYSLLENLLEEITLTKELDLKWSKCLGHITT